MGVGGLFFVKDLVIYRFVSLRFTIFGSLT